MLSWLFKKKEPAGPALLDRIWLDRAAADRAIVRAAQAGPLVVLSFFDATRDRVHRALEAQGLKESATLINTRVDELSLVPMGAAVIVAERHAVTGFNRALAERLAALAPNVTPTVFSSLDDPLMHRFGGERLQHLMTQLGLSADEHIEHPMLTKALANASKSLEQRLGPAMSRLVPAASMEEWLAKNLPPE
jgi:hypothetical protein